jgi:hypothetical protein
MSAGCDEDFVPPEELTLRRDESLRRIAGPR